MKNQNYNVTVQFQLGGIILNSEKRSSLLSEEATKNALHTLCLTELEKEKYTHMTTEMKMRYIKNVAVAQTWQNGQFIGKVKIMQNYQG